MGVVTVIGVGGTTVNLPFLGDAATALAQSLANVINAEVKAGTLLAEGASGIAAPALPAGQLGELVVTAAGTTQMSAGYKSLIVKANNETVLGVGETNQSVIASGNAMTFLTNGGFGSIVGEGNGSDVVATASGGAGWSVSFDGGNNTVTALTGNDTVSAGNGANSILLGTGNDLVEVKGQDTVQAGAGADTVVVSDRSGLPAGANPPAGSAVVFGGSGSLLFAASNSHNTVVGGTGSETIFGGSGSSYLQGGSGGNNYIMGAGTLLGGGSGDSIYATGSGNSLIQAGAGNETLSAALSSGADTFVASAGHDTITAGTGHDLLQIVNGAAGGSDLLLGFGGADSVSLSGYASGEASKALATAQHTAGGITVTLSDNTTITFNGVSDPNNIHIG